MEWGRFSNGRGGSREKCVDDIPEDEEDAFHRQRDVVLLNGGRGVGGGRVDEEDGE